MAAKARVRQFWISVHRWLGLATLAFLLVAAITGCFLCVDPRVDAALNPDLFDSRGTGPLLAPIAAAERFERAHPNIVVTRVPLHPAPGRTIQLDVAPRSAGTRLGFDQLFLDPHGGAIAGVRENRAGWGRRHIVQGVFRFHYTLLAGNWGRWLMGVAALGWLIGNAVGLYITFPAAGPFWRQWKKSWTISRGARLRRFMLELHRASGLWLLAGAMVLAFTSVAMNFYDEAFIPIVDRLSPARPSPFDRPASPAGAAPRIDFADALGKASAVAAQRRLDWQPATIAWLPDRRLYEVSFTDDGVENYHRLGPVSYYLDGASGRLVYADDPYRDSAGRKLTRSLYPLHSGSVAGAAGIAIIFLLGLATAEMCITGAYTWWKKRQSRRAMEQAKRAARAPA